LPFDPWTLSSWRLFEPNFSYFSGEGGDNVNWLYRRATSNIYYGVRAGISVVEGVDGGGLMGFISVVSNDSEVKFMGIRLTAMTVRSRWYKTRKPYDVVVVGGGEVKILKIVRFGGFAPNPSRSRPTFFGRSFDLVLARTQNDCNQPADFELIRQLVNLSRNPLEREEETGAFKLGLVLITHERECSSSLQNGRHDEPPAEKTSS